MPVDVQYYALNRGLDRIDYPSDKEVEALPLGMPTLLPPEAQVTAQLNQVLQAPTLSTFLETAFSPSIRNHALLSPQGFRGALRDSARELTTALKAGSPKSEASESTAAALRVVNDAAELQTALATFQGLLIPG